MTVKEKTNAQKMESMDGEKRGGGRIHITRLVLAFNY
jgi:hypothetical protein